MIATTESGCWPGSRLLQDAASVKAVLPGMPRGGALISQQQAEGWAGHPARERSSLQLVGSGVAASFSLARASGSPGPQARMAQQRGGGGAEARAHPGWPLPCRTPGGPLRRRPQPRRMDVDQELQDGPDTGARSRPVGQHPPRSVPRWHAAPQPQAPVWSWQPGSCFPTTFRTRGNSGPVSSRPGATAPELPRGHGRAQGARRWPSCGCVCPRLPAAAALPTGQPC